MVVGRKISGSFDKEPKKSQRRVRIRGGFGKSGTEIKGRESEWGVPAGFGQNGDDEHRSCKGQLQSAQNAFRPK